ncbi:MAG: hypothetical protein CBC66_003515 [Candidatus Pelagibacter sp. TMED106]|jgi:hypothetical protein|nr:MAG: hypothetical protein CBC66_003515 [Candidatus Pelagibacter sp. TMED106]|tara:strand:- start:3899 stop:4576 length:678 start_codon:yes stop_codon:yes gene_type:complete
MRVFFKLSFLLLLPTFLSANTFNYKDLKKIEMEIFRNNELIGFNHYFFKKDKNFTLITNEVKFDVKLLGATIFEFDSYSVEKYDNGQLVSFESKTKQNKKEKFVNLKLDKNKKKFMILGSSYTGEAETKNVIGNWWNQKIIKAESQISPISGSIKKQIVKFINEESIMLYGKKFVTNHFKLLSSNNISDEKKLIFDIWIDIKTGLILKVKYSKMGDWEYRLKNYN